MPRPSVEGVIEGSWVLREPRIAAGILPAGCILDIFTCTSYDTNPPVV